jgi:hypothetical protein
MGPVSRGSTPITIQPITSEDDLPRCAQLADIGLKPDPLHEFKARYSPHNVYDETLEVLTDALHDERQRFRLFKAVVKEPAAIGGEEMEVIVGFTQWKYGYLDVPKMDPFTPRKQAAEHSDLQTPVTSVAAVETTNCAFVPVTPNETEKSKEENPFYSNPHDEISRRIGNSYIRNIRGKKHVCALSISSMDGAPDC